MNDDVESIVYAESLSGVRVASDATGLDPYSAYVPWTVETGWIKQGVQARQRISGLLASNTDVSLTISDTSTYSAGETLLIDAERLIVRDIADATTLIVARAWDGSTLAVHANGTSVRRQLTLVVSRGAAGTTAATHSIAASVYRWCVPPLAGELGLAYAEDAFLQANSGYARTVGQGENERPATGGGIRSLETRIKAAMGRQARMRAV